MTVGKRVCLMIGGSQVYTANDNFNADRFWMGMFNLAVIGVLLWLSRPTGSERSTHGGRER